MKRVLFFAVLMALAVCACQKDEHINVNPSDLVGKWQRTGTEEYWRINAANDGVTWDESQDISEEESNLTFTWDLDQDEITCLFSGLVENKVVPKVYTIRSISGNNMTWRDEYGLSMSFVRVE
ncbi:MAG: hypothetical protein J6W88_06365 [Bacteroidales bacterium]|nr:hypothetical protein [Bacteroidales bacterium]